MTHSEKLQAVRAEIVKAVPCIMDLKWGCRIHSKYGHLYYTITCKDPVYTSEWRCISDGISPHLSTLKEEDFEILGRDIHLADVLLVIDKIHTDMSVHCNGQFIDYHKNEAAMYTGIFWNLTKDSLNDQSDETIDFLYSILVK